MVTGTNTRDTDAQVVTGLLSGSREAFRDLYARFAPMLLGVISRTVADPKTAEDLLQKSFFTIWNNRISATQPLFAWMLATTRETISAHYHDINQKDKVQNPVSFVNTSTTTGTSTLPPGSETMHHTVLDLVFYKGYSIDDAAGTLNIEKDNLKQMLRSAVNKYKTPSND